MPAPYGAVVIVGGSIAGVTAADELRVAGHVGPIVLIDEQRHRPYARPPLSKAILTGKEALDSAFLPALDDLDVDLCTDTTAIDLVPDEAVLILSSGERLHYDGLVVATGASPVTMADLGLNQTGLPELVLRTLDDVVLLAGAFSSAQSIIVVGGGILGMELASAARDAGLVTTVLTNEPPLLSMGGTFLSNLVSERAERAGVTVHHDPAGVELIERGGRLAASLAGREFAADIVVTAVGDRPRVEWLLSSGLADRRGVPVDSRCRVTANIVAAGDVTTWGDRRRTPHWAAAMDQARVAARALVAGDAAEPYQPRPYFWSDQFGLALKMAGECPFPGRPVLLDGEEELGRAVFQWRSPDGDPIGAMTVNTPMAIARLHRTAGTAPRPPIRTIKELR
ncbi:FAD-dependent oxidoreductase [Nocardioides sp. NPDC023903]|uniref:NAD(P)/FAD-dependent oxidoreductase n=1 Tax=Nocardioides sp. NPDC023903 TaxID=3157195 RepID=UPI0033C4DCB1